VVAIVLLAAAGGAVYAVAARHPTGVKCGTGTTCSNNGSTTSKHSGTDPAKTFSVASITPSTGATSVATDTKITVTFSSPPASSGATPTLTPTVAGTWQRSGSDSLVFSPSASFVPFTKYTVTVPGGTSGLVGTDGAPLAASKSSSFTIANGSVDRLQQLLAELGYLPLSYSGTAAAPQDMAMAQTGTLSWLWPNLPPELTDQWVQGSTNVLTKAAVMMFETENGLTVDGVAGPTVWGTLLADVASHKTNTEPLTYVLVTKTTPEHLTAWVNGQLAFHDLPVNTGVNGATTADGTFEVFEHVKASRMSGTDVTGTKYTIPTVPWASYFNGGDALHGFPRTHYGFPQSNGCVEMPISTAGKLWPYTPIGTLVTVVGPPA
jgi:peptidoglycan hydrolase-like protein with peptidoglycan-binding domain